MPKPVNAQDPHEESIRVVWHEPTQFDPLRHGPPYLPSSPYEPVKLSSSQRAEVQKLVKTASKPVIASENLLFSTLARLQALALLHQSHHWGTSGPNFFEDHLLFERIYKESLELIDQLAERSVGVGSLKQLPASEQAALMTEILSNIGTAITSTEMIEKSLSAEVSCVDVVSQLIETMKSAGTLSHGLSKLLEDIADKHETFVYLLSQRSKTESYDFR